VKTRKYLPETKCTVRMPVQLNNQHRSRLYQRISGRAIIVSFRAETKSWRPQI